MKKILSSILFLIISIAAFAQVGPNDLIIQGTVSSTISTFPISNWPVTISGMGMTETVYTNANGFYSDTISNGSEIGPNQLFIVQTFDCDSSSITNTVSNNQGTFDVANVDFQICAQNLPCNADFAYSGPLPTNNSYQFIGVANNDNAYHLWTFGDGASSEQEYPFHTYDTFGVYNVCHIVSIDGVCANTICNTIQVTDPACTAEIVMGYAPDGWPMFSAIGGSEIATYNWILSPYDINGIGYNDTYFYSTQSNAYVPAGTEYVGIQGCVSVTFTNGCAWSGCATFTAPPVSPCNANFYVSGMQVPDSSYQFVGASNENAYHLWTFGDGNSSTLESPSHSYDIHGIYSVCHIIGINEACADTVCAVVNHFSNEQCDAEFTVDDDGGGLYVLNPVSLPTVGVGYYQWSIDGGGFNDTTITGGPYNIALTPNVSYSICLLTWNAEIGCSASNCDTIVVGGITNTCSAEFTYTFTNDNFYTWPLNPHVEGNSYSYTVESSVYGILANNETSSNPGFPIPLDAGTVSICLNLTNEFSLCNATFCDTISVSPDTSCTADIVAGNGSNGWPEFTVNGGAEIASYNWNITTYDSNGAALEFFSSMQSNASIPAGTAYASIEVGLAIIFETGCQWGGSLIYTGQPDSSITCDASIQYSYVGDVPNPSMFPYQFYSAYSGDIAEVIHSWVTSDAQTSSSYSPLFGFAPGTYTICHSVFDVYGFCSDSTCISITVMPDSLNGCTASFNYTGQVANPLEVLFDASMSIVVGNNPSFTWDFGDGSTGTGLTVYHTYNIDGFYTVCLTAYSDSCSNTSCGGVYIGFSDTTATCNASFTMNGPMQPDSYLFTGVNNNSNAYHLWTFGDGTSSTLAMPSHSYTNPGTYQVCHITGIEGVCADTVCNTFYIGLYLAGTVNVGANCIDFGSVKLYSLDTLSNSVELIGQYPMDNNLCYYNFIGLTPGIYLVRAGLSDSSSYYNDYVPTYFGSQYYWNDAEPIYLTQSGDFYNISLIYGSNPGGNGTVNGSIDDGPFRLSNPELSSSMSPVLGAQVVITDLANVPQRWVRTDNSGAFSIADLAYGTYRLMADEPGMTCLPIEFTLSEQTPGVTIDLVMGDEITGIVSYETPFVQGDIYPNPSNSLANLNIELMKPASLTMTMTSITGQVMWTHTNSFLQGKASIQIPVRGIADGLYFLSIYSDKGQLITSRKMQVAN